MVRDILFSAVLLYASCVDIKTRSVQHRVCIAIIVLSLFHLSLASFLGAAIAFIPLLVVSLFTNLGGGDVKLVGACGLYLGLWVLPGLISGLLFACITMPIIFFIQKKSLKGTSFPLVPFLSLGFIIAMILRSIL